MKVRHQAREIALQALYEMDCTDHSLDTALAHLIEEHHPSAQTIEFATTLVRGVQECRRQLDQIIAKHAPEWPVDQLAAVDRNILRIALYELQHVKDVPIKVAINEAVELAKTFGSDTAPRFVNGVLGAFMQEHSPAELRR